MIGSPPSVRGLRANLGWGSGVAVYLVTVLVGSMAIGTILNLCGRLLWHPAAQVVGVIALGSAGIGSGLVRIRLPESTWQVPQSWRRFGHTAYAALFGGILGIGVATAVSSIGLYTLLAWSETATRAADVWQVFIMFGAARGLPLLAMTLMARGRKQYPSSEVARFDSLARRIVPLELATLTAIGALFLLPVY
jgi:hypothetical protein